ncbi:MAG: vWA domain-containing protein [Bacillota bacterium]
MRLKQNLILGILIIILISSILAINMFNILSVTKEDNPEFGREIKVDNPNLNIEENSALKIVLDVSNSMWGQVDNKKKINITKEILTDICNQLPTSVYLGLRSFGNQPNQAKNSFLAMELAQNNNQPLIDYLDEIKPAGKSPIGLNLLLAQKDLENFSGQKHILLVTDGKDTGKIMPTKIIEKANKLDIKTHVIQVGQLDKVKQLKLKNLAELGNGKYFTYFEEQQVVPTINLE